MAHLEDDPPSEREMLDYLAQLAESLVQAAEALYGGHQIGFPDIKGVTRKAVMEPQYLEFLLESVRDQTILEELRAMRVEAQRLGKVDEQMAIWLSQHHEVPAPMDTTSKERLFRIVDAGSAGAARGAGFPPAWVHEESYKNLLADATKALKTMREHKKRLDSRLIRLLSQIP